ncbi:MAG TPA: endonuclease V [Myxococcales bacterium]|nr:endonuclease V [Myxococcales bacterium]
MVWSTRRRYRMNEMEIPEGWEAEQLQMASSVEIPTEGGYVPQEGDRMVAFDIQYEGDIAHVAATSFLWGGEKEAVYTAGMEVDIPYISGYFCFREGPPLLAMLRHLEAEQVTPACLIVDGHGLAHPRLFGAACWLGDKTGLPTLGIAKDTLVRFEGELAEERGSTLDVVVGDECVGHVLRRRDGIRPVYVSPGHLIRLDVATDIALQLPSKYRIPDPIRWADQAARARAKGEHLANTRECGTLSL